MERENVRLQYYAVSSVAAASLTIGVVFSWVTPVLPKIAQNEIGFPISKEEISWMVSIASIGFVTFLIIFVEEISWMVSIASIGFVTGSFGAKFISDKFGRRIAILGSCLPYLIGSILVLLATNAWLLLVVRFLWGTAMGMKVAVTVVYVSEISHKDIRGRLTLGCRVMYSVGCLLVIIVGAFVTYQTLNYIILVLPVLAFMVCWWIPESPYYLLKQGKKEIARKTLQRLTGIQDEDVLEEKLSQMHTQVKVEMRQSSSIKEFLTGKQHRKAIFIVIGLRLPQIMTGLHAIQYYLGSLLLETKSGLNVTTALIIFGAVRSLLALMSSALVDRLGRRPLLVGSFFGTAIVFAGVATYFGIQDKYAISYPFSLIPFIGIIIAIFISNLGFESVSYLVPSELFPLNVKSIALAMTSIIGGLCNFISAKTYQPTVDLVGFCGLFASYAIVAFGGAVFCYYFVPETKGKSLKEIQILLNGNIYDEEEKLNQEAVNNSGDVTENANVSLKSGDVINASESKQTIEKV